MEDRYLETTFMRMAYSHSKFSTEVREVLGLDQSTPLNKVVARIRMMKERLAALEA